MTTGISWTEETWNPTTGCDRVSEGCDHCYAMTMAKRLKGMGQAKYQRDGNPRTSGPGFGVSVHPDALDMPLRWRKPRKVFVNSMSDLFHDQVSTTFIAAVFDVMRRTPQHTYQILTKRHARMRSLARTATFGEGWPLPNVHLGVSVENQQWADIRIPALLATPAAVRFLSCEPLLGAIDLTPWLGGRHGHAQEPRGRGVQGGRDGRTDDRRDGPRVAGGGTSLQSLDGRDDQHSLRAEAGGAQDREVYAGPGDVRRGACPCAGSQAGMAAFQGPDPGRPHREPQERQSHRELAFKPGTGDLRGAGHSCPACTAAGSAGSVGNPQRNGQANVCGCSGDLLSAGVGGASDGDRRRLWRGDADHFQDRAGRPSISWLIAGGESGAGARPCELGWLRSLQRQCAEVGVPFFCKQLGAVLGRQYDAGPHGADWDHWPEDLRRREFPVAAEAVPA